ncbi:MAG TPA: TonB-dependent receptor [Thermoanaerobaculia bacterium]|nr:TonB-dependent receptor [Thermoanaerobaculia bacterium]
MEASFARPGSARAALALLAALLLGWAGSLPVPAQEQPAEDQQPAALETGQQAEGEPTPLTVYEEIEVTGRGSDLSGIAGSATEGVTGREDLARRPILRPGELLETVPGVVVTQHSGGGKANQYFLRGWNLDHGTDFRVSVDGIQVNMPSHGHGQGYSDLSFLIPELVEEVWYEKGLYSAEAGDFSAAGFADLKIVDRLERGLVQATPGTDGYGRLLIADSLETRGGGTLLGGLELQRYDGPWERRDGYEKANGVLRWNRGDSANGLTVSVLGYDGTWDSTDQIPRREVAEGRLGRFGLVDDTDGGESSRHSLSAEWRRGNGSALTRLRGYALFYDLQLFSNFTYFLDDPENGDQFEQADDRRVAGFDLTREWSRSLGGREVESSAGVQLRYDDIANGLYHTRARRRLSVTREDEIGQLQGGLFYQARVRWAPRLRTVAGLRADYWRADVDSNLAENSGVRDQVLISPKLSLLLGPWKNTEVYLNAGYGFHSNDARGATIRVDPRTGDAVGRVDPLVRARSGDVGIRGTWLPGLQTTASAFVLELDSELVFIGDAGATEASRASRRTGVELANFYRLNRHWSLDADLAWSRGRFTDDDPAGDRIPGAVEGVAAVGVAFENLGPLFGALRLRYLGPRPLIEDDSVRAASSALVNARLGYTFANRLSLALDVFNLFDREVSDIDYFYASRLPGEPVEGVEDIHFHPAEPRSARLTVRWEL